MTRSLLTVLDFFLYLRLLNLSLTLILTPDSWPLTLDSCLLTLDSWLLTLDSWLLTLDTRPLTLDPWFLTLDSQLFPPDLRRFHHPMFSFKWQGGFNWPTRWFQLSDKVVAIDQLNLHIRAIGTTLLGI